MCVCVSQVMARKAVGWPPQEHHLADVGKAIFPAACRNPH